MALHVDRFARYADDLVGRAWQAAERFRRFDQAQVDRIVRAVFERAYAARLELARLAFEETGMGLYEHKVVKNAWASLLVYEDIRDRTTVGIVAHDEDTGITEIAQPKGALLATIPVTNPTSTTIFKILICMKTRNPVILSPHRGARKCIRRTAEVLAEAALEAGAPPDAVQWIHQAESAYLDAVMRHRRLALILATGTSEIVARAQASGTPTLGVGPGNVPVYVHASADLPLAARTIVHSKTFDNGVVCASEQALVVEPEVDRELRPLLTARGAAFCTAEQTRALGPVCFDPERRTMRADVVGKPAPEIARRAGFEVPENVRLLIASPDGIGAEHPLSHEILAPVLAYYVVPDDAAAYAACEALNRLGGIGHTVGLWTREERLVADFAQMNAGRIVVNHPSTEGAIGGIFNALRPSLTLACGTGAGNLDTDNITIDHLLNIHRVARRHLNRKWLDIPRAAWLDPGIGAAEIEARYGARRPGDSRWPPP
jgi:acetaldehyde dehydrogenase/alcohol dehydrogenase